MGNIGALPCSCGNKGPLACVLVYVSACRLNSVSGNTVCRCSGLLDCVSASKEGILWYSKVFLWSSVEESLEHNYLSNNFPFPLNLQAVLLVV